MNKALMSLFAASAIVIGVNSSAQTLVGTITNQTGDTNAYYEFAQSSTTFGFIATSVGLGVGNITQVPIKFQFNIPVPQFPTAIQKASLYFAASANVAAVDNSTSISQTTNGTTVSVFVDPADPTYGTQYGNQLIFQATMSSGVVSQTYFPSLGPTTYAFNSGSNGLNLSSAFVTMGGAKSGAFTLNTNLGIGGKNQVLSQFLSTGTGQFFSATASATVPEPTTVAFMLGTGVTGSLFLMRRKRK